MHFSYTQELVPGDIIKLSAGDRVPADARVCTLLASVLRVEQASLRSEVNIELNFPPKLRGARSRLYRRRFLQVNTRWKALDEIYKIYILLHRTDLKNSAKNRQHFFHE